MWIKKPIAALPFLAAGLLIFCGCKKEVVESQAVVQEKLLGRWPLKYHVKTVFTNNIAAKPDTLTTYNPVDTLVFTDDGMVTRRNEKVISTVGYTVDAAGENITFNSDPVVTLKITFIKHNSIGFGTEVISNIAGKEIKTVEDDHYLRF